MVVLVTPVVVPALSPPPPPLLLPPQAVAAIASTAPPASRRIRVVRILPPSVRGTSAYGKRNQSDITPSPGGSRLCPSLYLCSRDSARPRSLSSAPCTPLGTASI